MPTQTAVKDKLSIVELSALYDRIYDIADRLIKKHNPCKIHTTKTGLVLCKDFSNESRVKYAQQHCGNFLCCGFCGYLSKTGCTVKCLPCKLFTCSHVTNKVIKKRLHKLRDIAIKSYINPHVYYRTKSEVLKFSRRQIW